MIVADMNLIASLILPSEATPAAEAVLKKDPEWTAPALWRYEFKNVLSTQIRVLGLPLNQAIELFEGAEEVIIDPELEVNASEILRIACAEKLAAYDAEFVALAAALGIKLVTLDKAILKAVPDLAITPLAFANS